MFTQNLHSRQFKIIKESFLTFSSGLNLIVGNNGFGKTSLLEALHIVLSAHSFNKTRDALLVMEGYENYTLSSQIIKKESSYNIVASYSLQAQKKNYTIDSKKVPQYKTLLNTFPVVYFSPFDVEVVRGTPNIRRQFFDRVISYFNGEYYEALKQYNNLIKEKNLLLKRNQYDLLEFWNSKIIPIASFIVSERHKHLALINNLIEETQMSSPIIKGLSIGYEGAASDIEVEKKILQGLAKEKERRMTLFGPHRDFFTLKIATKNQKIRDNLSLGQTKVLSFYIKVLEVTLMNRLLKTKPIFLVDDVFSELDSINKSLVKETLLSLPNQIFITTTKETIDSTNFNTAKYFEFIKEGIIL